ncbi:ABC transporter substrate-binding protein [Caballeronia sp. LZ065]|uniref:ABC transporter substrate-binding protein n=1 Tax=Caballeronia sp. LZ065 TaxID=3038571 RepID=UPI0028552A33|nr:ABC transporter substrate-binding protein [Caballeronia sp. LZ065]MDR5781405.1 ABC transporter substrate-binding protein [Caballeronia sp. LZ065]
MTRSTRANLTLCALAASLPLVAAPGISNAQDMQKITMAVGTTVIDASQANNTSIPLYTKCWQKQGLDVTIQPINSTAGMQAVLSGQAQFVNMAPGAAIVARSKGAPIKAVYLNIRHNFQFPVVLDSSPIKSIKDFKGKTIGVISYGAVLVNIIKGQIAEAGLDPDKDVTFVETGTGAQAITALRSGKVDIWGTWDSQIALAEDMGLKLRVFKSPSAEKLTFGSAYFVRDDYTKSHPDVIEKLLRCVVQGTQITMTDPQGAIRAHWEEFPASKPTGLSDAAAMKQALALVNMRMNYLKTDAGEKMGETPSASATAMVDFLKANKQLAGPLDPKDVYTNQFIPAANQFDSQAVKQAVATLPKS